MKPTPTFARPPMANELLTKEVKERFDDLSSKSRALIKNVIDTDDVQKALRLAGFNPLTKTAPDDKNVTSLMDREGLTPEFLLTCLKECCEASIIKLDKAGNPHVTADFSNRLRALELSFRLRGFFSDSPQGKKEKSIMELFKDTELSEDERKDTKADPAPSAN